MLSAAALTVCCVYVKGPYPYTPEYVYRLKKMVERFVPEHDQFVCLTDRPEQLPGIECIPITVGEHPADGYWAKVQLFNPDLWQDGRLLYLDLDSVIVSPLREVLSYQPDRLCLIHDRLPGKQPITKDRYGRTVVRRFNSSVMTWAAKSYRDLFLDWDFEVAETLSTDQDWFAIKALDAVGMPVDWFPRLSKPEGKPPLHAHASVILAKKPKGHEACAMYPWFDQAWGGWP